MPRLPWAEAHGPPQRDCRRRDTGPESRLALCPLRVSPTGSRFIPTLTLALTATKPRKEGWGGPGGRSVPTCWGLTF